MNNFFVIKSDQITRLKAFDNIVKKINSIQPLNTNSLFHVKDNKLSIYGYGGGSFGHGAYQASFDIETNSEFNFLGPLQEFIKFIDKTKSDKINVSFNDSDSKLTIKGNSSKSIFTTVVLSTTERESTEIVSFLESFKNGPTYANGIDIILTPEIKDSICNFCTMTGLLKTNDCIVLEDNFVKSIDNVSIIKQKFKNEIVSKPIYLNKLAAGVIDKLSKFRYCELNNFSAIYGNIEDVGVEFFVTQPEINYQNVTAEEAAAASPTDDCKTIVKFKSEDLLKAFEEFEGVFGTGSWIYKQVYFKFNKETKTVTLEYDDMANQCVTDLQYEEVSSVNDDKEPFFLIPTIHFKYLKPLLTDEITFSFNCNEIEEEHSQAVIFENENITALLMKMSD